MRNPILRAFWQKSYIGASAPVIAPLTVLLALLKIGCGVRGDVRKLLEFISKFFQPFRCIFFFS